MAQFADGKDENALRTIGEVSEGLGIKPHILRYWEEQFPQLSPLKRAGGRRLYRPSDVALVEHIDRLINREGFTMKGARKALAGGTDDGTVAPHQPSVDAGAGDAAGILPRLMAIRQELAAALAA